MTWKFIQIKPMKARGKLLDSCWDDKDYIAEEKYDGDRRIAQFCRERARFTGTRESVDGTGFVEKTANLPHLKDGRCQGRDGRPPRYVLEGTVLDGEMIPPPGTEIQGGGSKYVTSIMGSKPEEAIRKQRERGYLCYVVFDCLFFKGQDIRNAQLPIRRNYAEQAARAWGNSYVSLATQAVGVGKRKFFDRIVGRGGEGVVLKRLASQYGQENLWIKVKAEATADVVVMGYKMGNGKYAKMVGAILFGQYKKNVITPMGSCRGFTDALMLQLTRNSTKYKGRVLRIKHNGREPTGAFRHPRFDCWREDKSPKDCVYDPEET